MLIDRGADVNQVDSDLCLSLKQRVTLHSCFTHLQLDRYVRLRKNKEENESYLEAKHTHVESMQLLCALLCYAS